MIDENSARQALTDPATDAVALAHIVQQHPQLGPLAAQHPQAYPELVQWIQQYSAAAAAALSASTANPAAADAAATADADASAAAATTSAAASAEATWAAAAPAPAPAAAEQPAASPRRRPGILLVSLAVVAALLVGSAGVTGAFAITRALQQAPSTGSGTQGGSGPQDSSETQSGSETQNSSGTQDSPETQSGTGSGGQDAASGTVLPYTDTASGAADLVESSSTETGPVILILDASGSMVRETSTGRSRMQDAQEAMTKAIALLPDDSEVGMLVFGTGTGNDDSERAAGCQDVKTLQPLGPLDRKALTKAVDAVTASGFTPLGPSMRTAASLLPADGPGTIVVVSDGVDTCSPPPACEVASELRGANPELTIHAVGFAIDDDEAAQQQLECIGRVGGGGYVSAANVQQLSSRIARAGGTDTAAMLSDSGYRGIRLGMTLAEVEARVDGFEVIDEKTVDGVEYVYVDCGLGALEFRSGALASISPKDDEVATLDGIALGAKTQTANEVYGEPVDSGEDADGAYRVYRLSSDSPYAYRVYGDGTITRIVLCSCLPASLSGGYSSWEITFDAVGPIRLGMTVDEVRAVLPEAGDFVPADETAAAAWHPLASARWLSVEIADGTVSKVVVRPMDGYEEDLSQGPALPHIRGIRIGDTMQTVYNYIPGGTDYDIQAAGLHSYIIAARTGQVVSFSESWGGSAVVAAITLTDSTRADINFDAPAALDFSAFPAELQGTWCQREDPSQCFSLKDLLAEYPNAAPMTGGSAGEDGVLYYGICLEPEYDGDCITAATMGFSYYPEGVEGDCAHVVDWGWPGCENDYAHDLSEPRLVIQANHQQGDLYWDQPPMYRQ